MPLPQGLCAISSLIVRRYTPYGESGLGGGGVEGRDNAWRNRAPGSHARRTTARQAMDGLWTETHGQQKQANDPGNNQHILNTPNIGRR